MSPGWQLRALHNASKVENRIALALSFLRIDKLAGVIPTLLASSVELILRRAIIISMLAIIGIVY